MDCDRSRPTGCRCRVNRGARSHRPVRLRSAEDVRPWYAHGRPQLDAGRCERSVVGRIVRHGLLVAMRRPHSRPFSAAPPAAPDAACNTHERRYAERIKRPITIGARSCFWLRDAHVGEPKVLGAYIIAFSPPPRAPAV